MSKKRVAIKDWEFARYGPYIVLVGRLLDDTHPTLGAKSVGHRIRTSPVHKIHKEESIVETENTLYVLIGSGQPGLASEYAKENNLEWFIESKGTDLVDA